MRLGIHHHPPTMASSPLAPPRTCSALAPPPPPCGRSTRRSAAAAPRPVRARVIRATNSGDGSAPAAAEERCLRCGGVYRDDENHPTACAFHGHVTGEKGLFSLSPPHQGIDGEWSDRSGVIVYRWNDEGSRPTTGRANWRKRWSCCQERDEDVTPCHRGWHVSYDDGYTLF